MPRGRRVSLWPLANPGIGREDNQQLRDGSLLPARTLRAGIRGREKGRLGNHYFKHTDASGGVSREAHDMAVLRMVQAGAVPITWIAVMSEWQRDWAREGTVPAIAEVTVAHGGASGVAFAWEQQLLNSGKK
jgi:hypothetical protein